MFGITSFKGKFGNKSDCRSDVLVSFATNNKCMETDVVHCFDLRISVKTHEIVRAPAWCICM